MTGLKQRVTIDDDDFIVANGDFSQNRILINDDEDFSNLDKASIGQP